MHKGLAQSGSRGWRQVGKLFFYLGKDKARSNGDGGRASLGDIAEVQRGAAVGLLDVRAKIQRELRDGVQTLLLNELVISEAGERRVSAFHQHLLMCLPLIQETLSSWLLLDVWAY